MGKNCREFIHALSDFVDGEAAPDLCREIERHVGQCENCRIMVDTLQKTVRLCCEGKERRLPESLEKKLGDLLRSSWEKKFGSSGSSQA